MNNAESGADLTRWIDENMTAEPTNILWEQRERAAKFVFVATDGSVVVKPNEKFTDRRRILAYFVGKPYAAARGHAPDDIVTTPELVTRLGLPEGTVYARVKELKDSHLIESVENGRYRLPIPTISRALDELENTK